MKEWIKGEGQNIDEESSGIKRKYWMKYEENLRQDDEDNFTTGRKHFSAQIKESGEPCGDAWAAG